MKKNWQNANVSISESSGSYDAIINGKRKTALQNLADRYKRFSVMGIVLIMLSMSYIFNPNIFPGDLRSRIFLGVSFGLYALVASVMDRWLYHGIRGINVVTMPVTEVIRKALFYRKRHLQFIAVLLPVVLAIIGAMAWSMDNIYFRLGILVGFVVGTCIGIIQLMDFLADYRAIISDD
ncbi:MAG: hypothetical protein K2K45_09335 [Muribaculaceae bacterium]|nr:hypothetical protein [Muribaculaceae bacterium]MDE7096387.1 hypothetical protein [Muribaculaceae bacterium]